MNRRDITRSIAAMAVALGSPLPAFAQGKDPARLRVALLPD